MNYKKMINKLNESWERNGKTGHNTANTLTTISKYISFGTGTPYGTKIKLYKTKKVLVRYIYRNRKHSTSLYIEVRNEKTLQSVFWVIGEPSYKYISSEDEKKNKWNRWYMKDVKKEAWSYINQMGLK